MKSAASTMTNAPAPDEPEHVDEFLTPPQLAFMKRLVLVLGIVLIFGFISLVVAIIYKANQLPANKGNQNQAAISAAAPAGSAVMPFDPTFSAADILAGYKAVGAGQFSQIPLPKNTQVMSSHLAGNTLVMTLRDQAGYAVMRFDLGAWKVTGLARLGTSGKP